MEILHKIKCRFVWRWLINKSKLRSSSSVSLCLGNTSLSPCRSAGYTQKRLTEKLKVPYYVGEQFSKDFTGMDLKNLERAVEDDYISNLRNNCWKEKQQSRFSTPGLMIWRWVFWIYIYIRQHVFFPSEEGMLYRARYFGDSDLYQRAQRARTPSCAKLSEITASLHGWCCCHG